MKLKKILIFMLIVLMVTVTAVGCRPEETPPPPAETPEDVETPEDDPDVAEEPGMTEVEYQDGTYRGELDVDQRGWTSFVEFTVEDGRIVEVNYDEFDQDENLKSEDEEYNENWESVAGVSAGEAYPALEEQLIETQNIEAIDTVSGATASTNDFVDAVLEALKGGPME